MMKAAGGSSLNGFEREEPRRERVVIGSGGAFQQVDEGDFFFFG